MNDNNDMTDDEINALLDNMVDGIKRGDADAVDNALNGAVSKHAGNADNFMKNSEGLLDDTFHCRTGHDWKLPYSMGIYDDEQSSQPPTPPADNVDNGFHNDKPYIDVESVDEDDVEVIDITTDE